MNAMKLNTSLQTVNTSQSTQSTTPSMLQELQTRAHAGLQATTQIVKEQVGLASQAANERLKVARAGKKLLDEGGEGVAVAVMAKKASIDASALERSISNRVSVAVFKLGDSTAKLRTAQHASEGEGNAGFSQCADDHEARAATYRQIAHLLEIPASCAEMSPAESDALAIVQAKTGCVTVLSRASEGLECVRQRTMASMSSAYAAAGQTDARAPQMSHATGEAPTLLQSMHTRAQAGLQIVQQAASDRIETAKAGKRLLDERGDNVAKEVVAKKAAADALDIDRDVAQRVQTAIVLFEESAVKLKSVQLGHQLEVGQPDVSQLADEHEKRANTYKQIAVMLEERVASMDMNQAEMDALSLVKVKGGCDRLQNRTNEGFEVVKNSFFDSCASEMGREGHWKSVRSVCA